MKHTLLILILLSLSLGCRSAAELEAVKLETLRSGCAAVAADIRNGSIRSKAQAIEAFRMETANLRHSAKTADIVEAIEKQLNEAADLQTAAKVLEK
ncbi:hypothetical protein FACS1894170_01890 [Planctomycetales bacterium]|nr:hypothetical protein FACS1894170_01890 [Planctomycetales bacterium]